MPRDLTKHDRNEFRIIDPLSGDEILFFHRTPTTTERVRYNSAQFKRQGTTLVNCGRTAAIDAAASVLTGIREGDFIIDGQPLSSDETSPHYRADWKELIRDMAGDLLFVLGQDLFGGKVNPAILQQVRIIDESEATEAEAREEVKEILPLAKNSDGSGMSVPPSEKSGA